jgi:hypothetical protein
MIRDSKTERHFRMLKVELSAARKLARKLQQLLWNDMAHFEADWFEFAIAYVLLLRAERTYSSIRTLARTRMVDDAFALVRVMVEKVINAKYILLTGTEAALDYMQYHAFREWRDFEDLQAVAPSIVPKYTAEVLDQLRSAHDRAKVKTLPDGSQKPRFGRGTDWIDVGLARRAEIIDEAIRTRFSMRSFNTTRILYHSTYKKGAAYLHGMWASLVRSFEADGNESGAEVDGMVSMSVEIRIKDKNPGVAVQALNSANLAALAVILFLGRFFDKRAYLEWAFSFKDSYLADLRKAKGEPVGDLLSGQHQ